MRGYREIDAIETLPCSRKCGGGGARKVAAGYIAFGTLYRRRICGAFRKRSRPDPTTHRVDWHEIARRPKAYRPILHGFTSWPTARLIAAAILCGKRYGHTRGTDGLTFSWLPTAFKFLFNGDYATIFYSYNNFRLYQFPINRIDHIYNFFMKIDLFFYY